MTIYIKNADTDAHIWEGQQILPGAYYQLAEGVERERWATSSTVLAAIATGTAVVALSNTGADDITDVGQAVSILREELPLSTKQSTPFSSADGHFFRGRGTSGVATAGQISNIDIQIPTARKINAVHLLLQNHVWEDSVQFQVIDIDGLYAPAGTVLNEFASSWNIDPTTCSQRHERVEYPATIYAGLYVRIRYTSTGQTDVGVKANLYLHEPPA